MNKFNQCIIIFGGSSEERMVSVASAQNLSQKIPEATLWFLNKEGEVFNISNDELNSHKDVFTKELTPKSEKIFGELTQGLSFLKNKHVIIALHGTEGEDGTLQKFFEKHQVPFTGSNSTASALAFDKFLTKELAKKFAIPVADDLILKEMSPHNLTKIHEFFNSHKKIVLKPLANGSSVGLFIVNTDMQLLTAIESIKKNGLPYIAEPFLSGREITVGVWEKAKNELIALPCSEVRVLQGRQFDYEGKYLGSGVEELTPAPITKEETLQCQDIALKLHQLVGCHGYSRTDMILTEKGAVLLEINTLPGLSKASFIPQQLAAINVDLRAFFESQISL